MLYLAIETSCDETSLCILEGDNNVKNKSFYEYINSFEVRSNVISSQVDVHKQYGGVVPEIGAREHSKQIHFLFEQLIEGLDVMGGFSDKIDYLTDNLGEIFVTVEPGLRSALRVGQEFAKSIRYCLEKRSGKKFTVTGVNHLNGHLISCFFDKSHSFIDNSQVFPHLHLIVSGGNSQILMLENPQKWEIVGATLDDAAGESFDKIGRMLGLPYPGGVWISKIAGGEFENKMNLPIGMSKNNQLNYSFSGLKTSCRNFLEKGMIPGFSIEQRLDQGELDSLVNGENLNSKLRFTRDFCISVQTVIVKQLVNKLKLTNKEFDVKTIGISGGVSANPMLRTKVKTVDLKLPLLLPPMQLTGDNAIMIALAGLSKKF